LASRTLSGLLKKAKERGLMYMEANPANQLDLNHLQELD
jgi:hypothetical protein